MQIVHPTTKIHRSTLGTIPVTGNFLVRRSDGMLEWNEPNEAWSVFKNNSNNRCVICNLRRDDSEHSSDLYLYTNITQTETQMEDGGWQKVASQIMTDNRQFINRSRKWYVRQFHQIDRVGPKRFTMLPLNAFWDMWRLPIDPKEFHIHVSSASTVRFEYKDFRFRIYIAWPEAQNGDPFAGWGNIIPWIRQHARGKIIPFSDYDVFFTDEEDETLYTIDIL